MPKRSFNEILKQTVAKEGMDSLLEQLIVIVNDADRDANGDYMRRLRVDLEVALLNYRARYGIGFDKGEQNQFEDEIIRKATEKATEQYKKLKRASYDPDYD